MSRCTACGNGNALEFDFTYAFQPIVDARDGSVFSYEALVRGPEGQPASWVLGHVNPSNQYAFDQACRVKALELASRLGMTSRLNINFLPNAIYQPEVCIRTTVAAARRLDFPLSRLIFEVVESERIDDQHHLSTVLAAYRRLGLATAIDDFGAGFAGLSLLADFQPDYLKLDMKLVRGIDAMRSTQAIVRGVLAVANELGIVTVAEGVETTQEYAWLARAGVRLFQGYLFARPAVATLPVPTLPALAPEEHDVSLV